MRTNPASRGGSLVGARLWPSYRNKRDYGAIAQVGERLLCKQEVAGSSPAGSIHLSCIYRWSYRGCQSLVCCPGH